MALNAYFGGQWIKFWLVFGMVGCVLVSPVHASTKKPAASATQTAAGNAKSKPAPTTQPTTNKPKVPTQKNATAKPVSSVKPSTKATNVKSKSAPEVQTKPAKSAVKKPTGVATNVTKGKPMPPTSKPSNTVSTKQAKSKTPVNQSRVEPITKPKATPTPKPVAQPKVIPPAVAQAKQPVVKRAQIETLSDYVKRKQVKTLSDFDPYLPEQEVISLVRQAVNKHEQWGMEGLQQVSQTCYTTQINAYRCLYFDLAARKIDLMVAQAFGYQLNEYFDDGVFGGRLVDVFTRAGRDVTQANEFLRTVAPQVNSYVVQKVKLSSFIQK